MNGPRDEWLQKADEDFRAAEALDPHSTPGVICFHCQQCIEKHLKAAAAQHGLTVPRTHNLVTLSAHLGEVDDRYAALADGLEPLNAYAVLLRYPGLEASAENALQARANMRHLRDAIRIFMGLEETGGRG